MGKLRRIACIFAGFAFAAAPVATAAGLDVSYAARFTRADGAPRVGTVDVTVRAFDAATGGTELLTGARVVEDVALDASGVAAFALPFTTAEWQTLHDAGGEIWIELAVSGDAAAMPRQKLGAVPLAQRVPVDGATLAFDPTTGALAVQAAPSFSGVLSGDVQGGQSATTVAKLQGRDVATAAPASGQVLKWNGAAWAPAADADSAAALGATVGTSEIEDGAVTAAKLAANGCASGQILKWNGAAWACAADDGATTTDASLLTSGTLPDARLSANVVKLGTSACANGQVLKSNGTAWVCAADVDTDTNTPTTSAADLTAGTLPDARLSTNVSLLGSTIESAEITDGTIAAADLGAGVVGDTNVAAGISATKIGANTSVSNAEFGYLDGVTSGIQTQLSGRVLDTGDTMTGALTLDPTGAAGTVDAAVVKNAQRLKFENEQGTPNTITFRAPTGVFTNQSYVLPAAPGTNGQVLKTDASGNLAWVTPGTNVTALTQIQIPACASGYVIKSNGDGTWACGADNDSAGGAGSTPADGSVTSAKLVDGAVTAAKLNAMGCVNGQLLKYNGTSWACASDDNNNVTSNASLLTSGTVADARLSAGVSLLGQTIGTAELEDDAVDAAKLADGAVGTAAIADGAVAAADLAGAIPDSKLSTITTAGKVSGDALTSGTIGGSVAVNSSGTLRSSGNVIIGSTGSAATELRLQDDDGSHHVAFKAPATVAANKVWTLPATDAAGVLQSNGSGVLSWATSVAPSGSASGDLTGTYPAPTIAAGAVTTAKLAADAVTTAEIAADTIAAGDIATAAVGADEIATGAVTTTEILDGTIATGDIAADTITAGNIATGAVTTAEILDATIASGDIAADTITAGNIATGAVASAEILDGTIAAADLGLANDSLSGDKIDGGTISNFASTGIDDNADANAVTIDSSERVGVGIASSGAVNAAFDEKLFVGGSVHVATGHPTLVLRETDAAANNRNWILSSNAEELKLQALDDAGSGGGQLLKATRTGSQIDTFEFGLSGSPTLYVEAASGGKVGIGTATPGQALTVAGTIETTSGGVKFPDGTTQSSAAPAAMACPTGFTAVEYNGRRLGCMQTDEADYDGDTTRHEVGDRANWEAATDHCFDNFGGRLPTTGEWYVSAANYALLHETDAGDSYEWANDAHFYTSTNQHILIGEGDSISGHTQAADSNTYAFRCWIPGNGAGAGSADWSETGGNVYRNSGNVGIGTTTPGQKLTVAGTIESTTGGVKFPDGKTQTTAVTQRIFENQTTFNSSNTAWTVPAGVYKIHARIWAGGGAGGSSWTSWPGAGGGSGGYAEGMLNVTPGDTLNVVVGAGGAGPVCSGNNGGAGGSSSVTNNAAGTVSITATGGGGGAANGGGAPGAGGSGSSGAGVTSVWFIAGQSGGDGLYGATAAYRSGGDGGNAGGGGGPGGRGSYTGGYQNGARPGGGGSGGTNASGNLYCGGAGGAGLVVLAY